MSAPRATMRLQFHHGFPFVAARQLAGYFAAIGISHIYSSPIMTARPGSMHGYDVIDPTEINPELGGEDEFRRLVAELRRHELGLLLDIVPNHMAIGSGNRWWTDVLAKGRNSRYAKYFDIDWEPPNPGLRNKVMLPVLGHPYGEALAAGELSVGSSERGPVLRYFDHEFPLTIGQEKFVEADFANTSGAGKEHLHRLLEAQHYRLAWWRCANDEINWRRFFDINELVAVRVEDDEVFDAVHAKLFALYAEGLVDGIRVDHIDGLAQPERYCNKLRARLRELDAERRDVGPGSAYFIVEKILARNEHLPDSWAIDGTTGYDFMDEVSAVFHAEDGEHPLRVVWERVSGRWGDFQKEEELARRQILQRSFSAQRDALVHVLYEIALGDDDTRDISRVAICRVLTEILAHFPAYRIYARPGHITPADQAVLGRAVEGAQKTSLPGDAWLVDTLGAWLAGQTIREDATRLQAIAMARFQQLTAPLCAKAVEDTAFYRYGRLLSRNDVGFDPRVFALPLPEFHRKMQQRAAALPHSMLATATHDHKRGEDVRARLAVLSELPEEWSAAVKGWLDGSEVNCEKADGTTMPTAADRAILFQTIVGAWPFSLEIGDDGALAAFRERVVTWQTKALREAKLHTDWLAPNERYEQAASEFVSRLLSGPSNLLAEIARFSQRIAAPGAVNGLGQVLVKLTAPGVPDTFQGTEFWDLSLVDPDNRSAVDFAARQKAQGQPVQGWKDGSAKQHVIARTLALRRTMPAVFAAGSYLPLETAGPLARHVAAYARIAGVSAAIIVFTRFAAKLLSGEALTVSDWGSTHVLVPQNLYGDFTDALAPTPSSALCVANKILLGPILQALPIALLACEAVSV